MVIHIITSIKTFVGLHVKKMLVMLFFMVQLHEESAMVAQS